DVMQHVEEVHADVGGDAAGLLRVALPALQVPVAARGDVGQVHFVLAVVLSAPDPFAQRDDRRVQAQLQDGVDALAGLAFDFPQAVDVPGVEHQRLLADRVRAGTQGETHV